MIRCGGSSRRGSRTASAASDGEQAERGDGGCVCRGFFRLVPFSSRLCVELHVFCVQPAVNGAHENHEDGYSEIARHHADKVELRRVDEACFMTVVLGHGEKCCILQERKKRNTCQHTHQYVKVAQSA